MAGTHYQVADELSIVIPGRRVSAGPGIQEPHDRRFARALDSGLARFARAPE
jgi:hypothetical protein